MSDVSYEILTMVKRTFHGKHFRAYAFTAQIIIANMSKRDFMQLQLPFNKVGRVILPYSGHVPAKEEKAEPALKQAITKQMNMVKSAYEKSLKVKPERLPITVAAAGNYKDTLST